MTVSTVVAIINGQEYTLTKNSGDTWSATITAPSQTSGMNNGGNGPGVGSAASGKGYYPVIIKATDAAGNVSTVDDTDSKLGDSLKLKVKETVAPVAEFTYPTASATITNNKPAIAFKLTDSGSGISPSTCKIKIDSGSETAVTLKGSGTTYTGTYTPTSALNDGSHTVTVYAYDYDGNKSNVASITFKVDTVPPTLIINSPADNAIFNSKSVTLSGTTNDVTSSPVTVTATLNGRDVGAITVGSNGTFSKTLGCSEGPNEIVITATDSAGKSTRITRNITVDTIAPEFGTLTISPNPTETGVSYTITVVVTDAEVSGVTGN